MGGSVSTNNKTLQVPIQKSGLNGAISPDVCKSMIMPIYYTKEDLTEEETEAATSAWKLISNNKAPNYLLYKRTNPQFQYALCADFFYDIFFDRLNDVHPGASHLFSKTGQRMRQYFLASITMLMTLMGNKDKFDKTLNHLAQVHNKIGVKAIEYGIVGEVLLFTIKKCCGEAFNGAAHHGWTKILSRMLDGIIPAVIEFEVHETVLATELSEKRANSIHAAAPWRDPMGVRSVSAGTMMTWGNMNQQSDGSLKDLDHEEMRFPDRP